jgi:mRNA interferase MazF
MKKGLRKGQVVWVSLNGVNSEQRGNRPCIIVQNNLGNKMSKTTIVVPLTSSRTKTNLPVHVNLEKECFLGTRLKDSVALCEQVRVIDKERITLVEDIILPEEKVAEIEQALLVSFGCDGIEKKDLKVVWVQLDGIGCEQRGNRPLPCVVLQNKRGNDNSTTSIVAPMGKLKTKIYPTQVLIPGEEIGKSYKDSVLMLEQIRVIDKSRITVTNDKVQFSEEITKSIEDALFVSLGIEVKR